MPRGEQIGKPAEGDTHVAGVFVFGAPDRSLAPLDRWEANMSRILGRLLAPVAALLLVTCHNEGPTAVASVTVAPPTASVLIGLTVQLTATTKDANQNVLTGRVVTWASGNTAVATVSATGLWTPVAPCQPTITSTSKRKSGTATVTVPPPVASATAAPLT